MAKGLGLLAERLSGPSMAWKDGETRRRRENGKVRLNRNAEFRARSDFSNVTTLNSFHSRDKETE